MKQGRRGEVRRRSPRPEQPSVELRGVQRWCLRARSREASEVAMEGGPVQHVPSLESAAASSTRWRGRPRRGQRASTRAAGSTASPSSAATTPESGDAGGPR